jgi:short-subunit dehydrogenase
MEKIKDWNGKTVIVTGASTGVGKSLCFELASRGAIVYVTARTKEKAQPISDDIVKKGLIAFSEKLEVRNFEEFKNVIELVKEKHGKLDVLINNAGILFMGEYFDMQEEDIQQIIQVNLSSVMIGSLYAYQLMKAQGSGLIVNISSMAGFMPAPSMVAYSATKHALLGFTKSLSTEMKGSGTAVKAVCLGLIESELLEKANVKKGHGSMYLDLIPMKPMPTAVAAKKVVDKISRKGLLLYVPKYARTYHHIQYFMPSMILKGAAFTMKKYREMILKS